MNLRKSLCWVALIVLTMPFSVVGAQLDDDVAGLRELPAGATITGETAILRNPALPYLPPALTAPPGPASDEGIHVAVVIADGHALRYITPEFMPQFSSRLSQGAFLNNILWDNQCAPNMTPAGFATIFTATCQPVEGDVSGGTPPDHPYLWEIGGRDFGWQSSDVVWHVGKARVDSVLRWSQAPGYNYDLIPQTTLILRWMPPFWRDGNDIDVRNAARSALATMEPKPRLAGEDLAQHDRMCHLALFNPDNPLIGYDQLVESLANSDSLICQAIDDYLGWGYDFVIVTADHHGRGDSTHFDGKEWRNHGGDGCHGDEDGWAAVFGAQVVPGTYSTPYTSRDIGRTIVALEGLPADHPDVTAMEGIVIEEIFGTAITSVEQPTAPVLSGQLAIYDVTGRRLPDSSASLVDGRVVMPKQLATGLYFVRPIGGSPSMAKKVVVVR